MAAIYKKELRTYLYSITGGLFAAVNLLVTGLYFLAGNLLGMNPSLSIVMQSVIFILLIMTPILTMRILAEEKKQNTDQLLLTAPVSVLSIVLGKYLAVLTVFLIPVGVSCILPLILTPFGTVAYAESYTAILGYFLFGAACISVGVFISAVTESQIIAAVLTFIALFLTFLMSGIVDLLTQGGNQAAKVLTVFDFSSRLDNFMSGVISIADTVYFLTIIVLMLFFTCQAIQKRRYTISKNTLSLSVYSNASILFGIGIAVALNLLVSQIPSRYASLDMTKGGLYTLDEDSVKFLNSLDQDISIYVIGTREMLESYDYRELTNTLEQYRELSKHVSVVYKDPALEPAFAQKYTDDQVTIGSVLVVCGDRVKVISPYDLYQTEIDYQTYTQTRTGYDGEGQLTSAIAYVTGDELPKLYVITGHSEDSLSDYQMLSEAISRQNIETEELNLMQQEGVPEDASAVFILAPKSDFSEDDAGYLTDYLDGGGKLIAALNYTDQDTPNLDGVLLEYGIERVNGIVLETDSSHMYQSPVYLLPDIQSTVLTDSVIANRLLALLPEASGLRLAENGGEDTLETEEALTTTEGAFAKLHVDENTTGEKEEGDVEGPFALAVYASEGGGEDTAKLAVFSCANMFADEVNARVGGANVLMVNSALNDMIDQQLTITIPAKSYNQSYLTVSYGTAMLLGLLFVLVIPLLLLGGAVFLWFRRRRL